MTMLLLFLVARISGNGIDSEWIIDEDSSLSDSGLDLWNDLGYPVYVNMASMGELRRIPFLTEDDIVEFYNARQRGVITGSGSLQALGLSTEKVNSILPFISFYTPAPLSFQQTARTYYRSTETDLSTRQYQKTELRGKDTALGFVSMSDYGSRDFTRHHSYYFSHRTEKPLQQIVMGKYRLSLGQGIAYAPQAGFSKSSAVTTYPVKNYTPLRPHSNPYKNWSLEGIAAHLEIGAFDLIPFYSETKIDASLVNDKISTIYPYGTTTADRRNSVEEKISGVALRFRNYASSYGVYYSQNRFDKKFLNSELPQEYENRGAFIYHWTDDFDIFGEYASIGNKKGVVGGIRFGRGKLQQLLLYRAYEKDIPHWHGNPFSSQANFDNEEGLYYGLRVRPTTRWTFNLFFDLWKHPNTRYFEKMPTTRTEQYLQIIHNTPRDTIRLKFHHKNYDKYRVIDDLPSIRSEHKTVTAIDWRHQLSSNLTKRSGVEYITRYIPEVKSFGKGVLLFENLSWVYRQTRFIYQINIFRSDISHYIYEYSLDGMWESRPLTGDDFYSYLIIKGDVSANIKLQSKFAYFFSGKSKSLITQIICRL